MKKFATLFFLVSIITFVSSQIASDENSKKTHQKVAVVLDTAKQAKDTTIRELKFYKKDAHASYYHNKFNGKRTASGQRFDNNKYTAAHRKFPFGTRLKITNQVNDKSVIVTVNDRGPFSRGREIDLSKRSFMEIARNKNSGVMMVTIEEITK